MAAAANLEEHRPSLVRHRRRTPGRAVDADVTVGQDTTVAAGGSRAMDPVGHGFMDGWSFYDPDGHHWEVLWMDPKTIEQ
jgi:predicted lactoylglutathione lyase